jgi:hypothetical protein
MSQSSLSSFRVSSAQPIFCQQKTRIQVVSFEVFYQIYNGIIHESLEGIPSSLGHPILEIFFGMTNIFAFVENHQG